MGDGIGFGEGLKRDVKICPGSVWWKMNFSPGETQGEKFPLNYPQNWVSQTPKTNG